MFAIRLPASIEKRFARLVKRTGRPKSDHVREAIEKYLKQAEEIYLAEKRLEEVRDRGAPAIPLEELMSGRGLKEKSPRKLKATRQS